MTPQDPPFAPQLIAEPLAPDQLRVAYPLIRHAQPDVDLQSWVRFARPLARPGRARRAGIVVVRYEGQHFPCGLFCYRLTRDLRRGVVIMAEHLVAAGLLHPDRIEAALLRELDALSARLGRAAVLVPPPR